jgi:hypothetical protein
LISAHLLALHDGLTRMIQPAHITEWRTQIFLERKKFFGRE